MLCFLAVSAGTSCTLNKRSFRCKQPFRGEGKIHALCSLYWKESVKFTVRADVNAQFDSMCSLLHACAWYLCYPAGWPCCSMPGCGLVLAWSHSSRHLEHQRVCSGQHTIVTKETKTVITYTTTTDHYSRNTAQECVFILITIIYSV